MFAGRIVDSGRTVGGRDEGVLGEDADVYEDVGFGVGHQEAECDKGE
jgi:hypothetical protein